MAAAQEVVGGRPQVPQIELGNPADYRYIGAADVSAALTGYGYGDNMKRVQALYISPDASHAVGVWRAPVELFEGHFIDNPVVRGVEQPEAIGQTLLAFMHFTGKIPAESSPRLTAIDMKHTNAAVPPADLNVVVATVPTDVKRGVMAFGRVLSGDRVISEGFVSGIVVPNRASVSGLERVKEQQATEVPIFPLVA